jgi:hypothetical protein
MMHLEPDELMQYFDGTLEDRRVREHLSTCVQCRSRLKDLALTRITMSPPRSELPGEHVPAEILAQYVEDTLSMEQNRAVEEHLGQCRRCLSDLVSLRTAMGMALDQAPPDAVSTSVKEHLDDYRRVTPLGSLAFKRFRDRVNLAYKPAPEPDDPEAYTEQMAKYRFPFKRERDLRSRVEDIAMKAQLRAPEDMEKVAMSTSMLNYVAGEKLQRHMPSEPSGKTITTDTALIFFSLDERDGKRVLTVEIGGRDGVKPLADVQITLTPAKGQTVTVTTDPAGKAVLEIPEGPSTLRIFLEKTYELDLRSLL